MPFSDQIAYRGLKALGLVSRVLSSRQRTVLGKFVGGFLRIDRKRVAITRSNVRKSLPDVSDNELNLIVTGAYHNLGITLVELLAIPGTNATGLLSQMTIKNINLVRERSQNGQPSILLSGHFGNWEYLAMAAGVEIQSPVTIVAHPQKNSLVDKELNSYRETFGNTIVPMHGAARVLVSTLTKGGTVAFLVDQHAHSEKDPWISFFGRKTPTYEAPAALALKYNVPIFYAFAVRQPGGGYVADLRRLKMDDLSNNRDGIEELTRRHVQALEQEIRLHPSLWSWQHRRWRTEQ